MVQKGKTNQNEKSIIKSAGFCACGETSMAAFIDVKEGKIVRIRPFHLDWKYEPEEFNCKSSAKKGASSAARM